MLFACPKSGVFRRMEGKERNGAANSAKALLSQAQHSLINQCLQLTPRL